MQVSGRRASSVDGVDQSSTDQFDKSCQPCAIDGQLKNAMGYCTNCDDYFCEECYKDHRNLEVTKHHVLVNMADMPQCHVSSLEASGALDDKLIDTCTEHAGKIVEYYCKTHTKTACAVCVTLYHRNCSDVQYIPDIAAGTSDSRECKYVLQEFNALTDKLTNMEFQAGESLEAAEKTSKAYSQQVQKYRDQLVAIIDKLAAEAEDKKKTYVHKRITQLNSIRKVSQDHRHSIEAVTSQITDRRLAVQEKMLFVSLKQAGILDTDCQNYITSVGNNVYASRIEFKDNTKFHDMFRNVRSLGDCVTSIQLPDEINVKAESEYECRITDLHILSDGRLIVAYRINKTVKLFDSNYRLKSRVQLQSEPMDMAEVNSGEVAVLLAGRTIQFMSISGDLNPGRTIQTGCSTWSMAVSRDIIIVLAYKTDTGGSCIVKLDLNGRKLHTIDISSINIQINLLLLAMGEYVHQSHIRIHPTNNNIYVSHGICQVKCMTQQGELVADYKDAELQYQRGLAIHADGSIYVCGNKSNNIHHITAECNKIDVILGPGEIKAPWCICFDRGGKLLYVSENGNNKIKVFRLFP